MGNDWLPNKRILIVDDEPDVLESLKELLPMCDVVEATNFEDGKELLETEYFDMAILDIMGVDGNQLLEIATERRVIPVMLTAHALSVEDTKKSFKGGAASYVPKEEMANIATFLNDIFDAKEQGKSFWWRWLDRFASYYDKKFGPDWQKDDPEFWKKFDAWM
jgi:DNA-binding NtrC family response regulator